jgi:DNA-binding GntR family transcriptional regulator
MRDREAAESNQLRKLGSLRERIYADLRARLQRCEFGADDRLVDVDVAATYGTSRMPVREALLQLVNEGYLVGTTRGFMVPTLTLEDVREIFEVRKLLEPRAAAHAARDLDASAEAALAKAVRRLARPCGPTRSSG